MRARGRHARSHPNAAELNDTAIPHFKIQITEIPLEKKLNTVSPHFPLHTVEEVIEYWGLKHPIIFDVYNLCHNYHSNKLSSFNFSVERHVHVRVFEIPYKSTDLKRDLLAKVLV